MLSAISAVESTRNRPMKRLCRSLFVLVVVASSCGGSDEASEDPEMVTELVSNLQYSACDGWGFSNLEPDLTQPAKIVFIEAPGVANVLATTLNTVTLPEENKYSSSDLLNLDYVGCFRATGRTPLDIECPMEFSDGTEVTPAAYELGLELYIVDAATGQEVEAFAVDAPFDNCPFGAQIDPAKPELYGKIDLDQAAELVAPLLER